MYKQLLHLVSMAFNLPKIRKGFTLMFAMMVLGITSVVALTLARATPQFGDFGAGNASAVVDDFL